MSISSVSLSASARANLSALQNTANLLQTTQSHLATGKAVNSAVDNATAFFASQGFLNRASQLSDVKNSLGTALQVVTSTTNSISDVSDVVNQLNGIVTQALGTTDTTTRAGLATQFNSLLTQLDELVNDASFNGTNLLNSTGSSLVVFFNETNTTQLTISGVNVTSAGLSIATAAGAFATTANIQTSQSLLLTALSTLRTDAANFGGNATLIQTRQDFTTNLINSLQTASDNLVLADTNQEGANLQALQAQDQLGIVSLGISGQLAQAILKLF
ncbi:MAG TPA: flagellin [Alphaproteobacteria bacterium]|nr:flagellin [Alphaproteobacteria bacterium]